MPLWDLSLAELEQYSPTVEEPADFDEFWAETLEETRRHDLGLRLASVETMLTAVESWDVTFNGFGGHPIRAWLHLPARYARWTVGSRPSSSTRGTTAGAGSSTSICCGRSPATRTS